jgi:hypothetical protein
MTEETRRLIQAADRLQASARSTTVLVSGDRLQELREALQDIADAAKKDDER